RIEQLTSDQQVGGSNPSRHAAPEAGTPIANTTHMSSITTREFVIDDYDAAVALWNLVEGVEVAEGDSKEEMRAEFSRNPGLSRIAENNGTVVGAVLCGHDGRRGLIYHL